MHRDVPDGFCKPMNSHMVQIAGDANKVGNSVSRVAFAAPQAFAVGAPPKGINWQLVWTMRNVSRQNGGVISASILNTGGGYDSGSDKWGGSGSDRRGS